MSALQKRSSLHNMGDEEVEECYENQRYDQAEGTWSSGSLILTDDRSKYTDADGEPAAYHPGTRGRASQVDLIGGWAWVNEWAVDTDVLDTDDKGWCYGTDWDHLNQDKATQTVNASGEKVPLEVVRTRKWSRRRRIITDKLFSTTSQALPDDSTLPFPRGPLEGGSHCWSEPDTAKIFDRRGKTYMKDWRKVKANPALFKLRSIDFFQTKVSDERRYDNFASHSDSYVQKAIRAGDTASYFIVVHFQMQPHHMCCTWIYDEEAVETAGPEFVQVWDKFLNGENDYRDSRFKVIPSVAEGNWMVKRAVGAKPALLATKLKHRYMKTERYFEIDCDVNSSYVAGSIVGVLKSYASLVSIDLGLTIEGRSKGELPEFVFACFRLTKPNLEEVRFLDNSNGIGDSEDMSDADEDSRS